MSKRPGRTVKTKTDVLELTQEEIDEINANRSPSERLAQWEARCGAKLRPRKPDDPDGPRKHNSTTCLNKAGMGTTHPGVGNCKFHGGNTPSGNKSAARMYGRSLIDGQRQKFGGDLTQVNVSPEEALLEEVRRSVAMVRWLEERIGTWQYEASHDPDAKIPHPKLGGLPRLIDETSRGASSFTDEREWLMLYREERAHAAKVSKMAIDAGLQERMVKIAEDQGVVLATAIRQVLDALALSPEQIDLVPQVVPGILRAISSDGVIQGELVG